MTSAHRAKASDKQGICKKLIATLKKRYKTPPAPRDRNVLDSMLYAVCLENCSPTEADQSMERLLTGFHDLNEIRVSSVTELASAFAGVEQPEWRAVQARGILQYVFEKNFAFEIESLRKKTLELAVKQLAKIRDLSPFVRGYTLQEALGSHVMPVDQRMCRAAAWLGLVDPGTNEDDASAALKPVIRKPDAHLFCDLLRAVATDRAVRDVFDPAVTPPPEEGFDVGTAPSRLSKLLDAAGPPVHVGTGDEADHKPSKKGAKKSPAAAKPKTHRPAEADEPRAAAKSDRKASEPKSARPKSRSASG